MASHERTGAHVIELLLEAERALSFGLVDRAEQLYRQVADADPHNSIAIVGLGRVALERADDLGAYLLARRALAIDPENDAARRLATRLEEVLATRGEPVDDPMPAQAAPDGRPAQASGTAVGHPDGASPDPGTGPAAEHATSSPPPPSGTSRRRRTLLDRLRRR